MSDIGLTWRDDLGAADVRIVANDFAPDAGLETAVMLSLFTDRRVEGVERDVSGGDADGGWWADALNVDDPSGSRLWTLAREKDTVVVLQRAPEYAREALAWMLTDGVASEVLASASSLPMTPGRSIMLLAVEIRRPAENAATFRYAYNWQSQEVRRHVHAV